MITDNTIMTTPADDPVKALEAVIYKYARPVGKDKSDRLIHTQDFNAATAAALAAYLAARAEFNTIEEAELLLEDDTAREFFTTWSIACDNHVYDTIQAKAEKGRDADGNEVITSVPTPHRINVSQRLDRFKAEIKEQAAVLLKQELRNRPVAWPEREPNRAKFLEALCALAPNVQNPAEAATSVTAFLTNIMANRGVEGARKQQKFLYMHQPDHGGGGKGMFQDTAEDYAREIGLSVGFMDPADGNRFVPDVAAYADIVICHEVDRLKRDGITVFNPIFDNVTYQSERKNCPKKTVKSRATVMMASQHEYPDPNRRRVAPMVFAANKIDELKADELKYYAAYSPKMTEDGIVRFDDKAEGVHRAWEGLYKHVVFDAVYKDPAVSDAKKIFPHPYLRALQVMQQFMDAAECGGGYAEKYGTALGCKVKTEFRDLDHCIHCAQKAEFAGFKQSRDIGALRTCLAQLINEAQRRGFWGDRKRGVRADRIPFSAFDFAGCTVDAPDINEGYSLAAIHARWDRLIAAYTDKGPTGGHDNDGQTTCRDQGQRQAAGDDDGPDNSPDDRGPEGNTADDAMAAHQGVGPGVADNSGLPGVVHPGDAPAQVAPLDVAPAAGAESTLSPTCADSETTASSPWAVSSTAEGPTQARSAQAGDFFSVFPFRDLLTARDKYDTDNMPLADWVADPRRDMPQYLVTAVHRPGRTGRKCEDLIPTYMLFESDTLSKEEQLTNIKPEYRQYFSWGTDSGGESIHWVLHLSPLAQKELTCNPDLYHDVWEHVNNLCFVRPNVTDEQVKSIGRLTRCPWGMRLDKESGWGNQQKPVWINPAPVDLDLSDVIARLKSKQLQRRLRAAFFDKAPLTDAKEALDRLDANYRRRSADGSLSDELTLAHAVVVEVEVDAAPGCNWLGGLNCLRGYRMPRQVLETYLDRVRKVHPTHLPQGNDYYLGDYGRPAGEEVA